jgi:hypothetical protein
MTRQRAQAALLADLILQILDQQGDVGIGPRQQVPRHRAARQAAVRRDRHGDDGTTNRVASDHDKTPFSVGDETDDEDARRRFRTRFGGWARSARDEP